MLRLVQRGAQLPSSFICDPSAEFQPGMWGQLTVMGNQIMATVSNGIAPIGIIDDIKSRAFTNVSWNEVVIVPAVGVAGPGGTLITPIDVKAELKKSNILSASFTSTVDVELNAVNGVITFPAGTVLNTDIIGAGEPTGIRTICNYSYYIANIPGDDSTAGSGRITIWTERMFFATNQMETNQSYPLNANIYCSEYGLSTTRKPTISSPAIAICTAPPTSSSSLLEMMLL